MCVEIYVVCMSSCFIFCPVHTYISQTMEGFESCEDSFMMGVCVCVCAMLGLILINQFW